MPKVEMKGSAFRHAAVAAGRPFDGGIPVWWSGNNRQDKTLKRVDSCQRSWVVVLAVLSYFVDTDKEFVVRQTRDAGESRRTRRLEDVC